MSEELKLTQQDFDKIETRKDLLDTVLKKGINIEKVISTLRYEEEKKYLQIELVKLQQWANKEKKRIAIIFEGRDAAGKGGNIRRFVFPKNCKLPNLKRNESPQSIFDVFDIGY